MIQMRVHRATTDILYDWHQYHSVRAATSASCNDVNHRDLAAATWNVSFRGLPGPSLCRCEPTNAPSCTPLLVRQVQSPCFQSQCCAPGRTQSAFLFNQHCTLVTVDIHCQTHGSDNCMTALQMIWPSCDHLGMIQCQMFSKLRLNCVVSCNLS